MEAEIKKVTSSKLGRCVKVFKMREVVAGPKKGGQEALAVKDSRSGELVAASSEIRRVGLEYCLDTLNNNKPTEKFKTLNELKKDVHKSRMKDEDGLFEITEADFWQVIERFELKKKRSYDFLTKAGEKFKRAFFKLCQRMNQNEKFPRRFDNTVLMQICKKGPMQELSSFRFIHMKEWGARLIKALEIQGMKEAIISAGTKFQLGGKTGMRVQFHIFVVKSVMAMVEEKKTGGIIYTADIQKFFDKEVLVDCMDFLAEARVDKKAYRNWYRLNQRCQVAVVTGAGMSEEGDAGEVVGQGSGGPPWCPS